MEERVQLFTDWMMAERDSKLKRTFFVQWMRAESRNRKFLRDIADKATAVYVTEGFAKRDHAEIERWLKKAIENNRGLTVDEIAHSCKNYFGLTEKMVPMIRKIIGRIVQNKRVREAYQSKKGEHHVDRDKPAAFKRLLAEGTYSMDISLAESEKVIRRRRIAQDNLPGVLDEPRSLASTKRIEDYEALIAPYRPLLAGASSMELLDDLLRLLYEEGDVSSVVGWRGKTSDSEYVNLREHKHFLEILQGISLYDHSYNVLKAALDIARDCLRQKHDLLLPSIVTAALAHDLGKIPSLWRSSTMKRHDHESVGAARLKNMLASHGNDAFKKSVARAVRLHHSGTDDNDTIIKITMEADVRAREYEITSADPTFSIKPMLEWLDPARFAELILPAINEISIRNRKPVWKAMSFDGIIYCIPEYVRSALKALAFEKKMLDYRLVRQSFKSDNRAVLNEVSGLLSKNGFLAYDIKKGNFGLRFLFQSSIPSIRDQALYAIPLKGEFFPVEPSELEKRKIDYLKTIVSVRPTGLHF
jgi:hypothetical protein